jgi:hypothetical protein
MTQQELATHDSEYKTSRNCENMQCEQSRIQIIHELLGCVKAGEKVDIADSLTHRDLQQSLYGLTAWLQIILRQSVAQCELV